MLGNREFTVMYNDGECYQPYYHKNLPLNKWQIFSVLFHSDQCQTVEIQVLKEFKESKQNSCCQILATTTFIFYFFSFQKETFIFESGLFLALNCLQHLHQKREAEGRKTYVVILLSLGYAETKGFVTLHEFKDLITTESIYF